MSNIFLDSKITVQMKLGCPEEYLQKIEQESTHLNPEFLFEPEI